MAKVAAKRRVRKIDVQRHFKRCPDCEYADGFHVRFTRVSQADRRFSMQLICPMCGETFDMGIRIEASHGD